MLRHFVSICQELDIKGHYSDADFMTRSAEAMSGRLPHKISIFDFDDTLAITECKTIVIKGDGSKIELTPAQFSLYDKEEGDEFDFTQFNKCIKARPIDKNMYRALMAHAEHGPNGIMILTARAQISAPYIIRFLKKHNLTGIKVFGLGSPNPHHKSLFIMDLIRAHPEIKEIYFIDDSYKNINAVDDIKAFALESDVIITTELFKE